ncbi:sensor histidine kinase [Salinicoccus sp. Marseille-QA3877]
MKLRSLYSKFAVTTIGIMIVSFLFAFFISNTYYQQYLKPDNDAKNTEIALSISTFIEDNPQMDMDDYLTNMADAGYQFYLVGAGSEGSFYGAEFRETVLPGSTIESVQNDNVYHGMLEFPRETFVTGFFANELENTIGVPVDTGDGVYALFMRPDISMLFNEMHLLFGWLLILTIVISIIFVLISTKYLVNPVTRLNRATDTLAKGNYNVSDLNTNRNDEIGQLSNSFVHMAEKIEQNEEMRKDFISNISHDIQSPLSNIKGYNELLKTADLSSEDKTEYYNIIDQEVTRISTMTNQLLMLSSLDQEAHALNISEYRLDKQIERLIHSYEWKINQNDMMLSYDLPEVSISADETMLNMVWDNLISNAVKYNSEAGNIDISLTEADGTVTVRISDTGIGLTEEEKDHIFDRFYRVDSSRTSSVKGSGLGLSIVHEIIQRHDGTVRAEPNAAAGTTFIVELPQNHK